MNKEHQTNLPFNCKDNWSHSKTNFVFRHTHYSQKWRDLFFFLPYAPLRADGNYNDIINRELLLQSSELYRQEIENASNIYIKSIHSGMHVTWYKYNEKTPEQRQNALRFIYNSLLFKSRHCRHIVACICCCELVCFCEV